MQPAAHVLPPVVSCVQSMARVRDADVDVRALQMAHQGPAALGIAVVAMSEDLGTAMAHRALEHLLQYGEPPVRSVCLWHLQA